MKVWRQISQIALRGILVIMILGMTDGHWAILQSIAWTKMIIDYSRAKSIQTAIQQTFDGQHPCELCKFIQKAKQSSQQQELQQPSVKDDALFLETSPSRFVDMPCSWFAADVVHPPIPRRDPPPVPPPRSLPVRS